MLIACKIQFSMDIFIPNLNRKRAIIIVDMQSGFLPNHAKWIIPNIQRVIQRGGYSVHVEAIFHADLDSVWNKQTSWTFELEPTIKQIADCLIFRNPVKVTKTTKSAFQGNVDLETLFKAKGVEEVHLVGVDANDCVLATAFDAFDSGFFTYVLEECVESSSGKDLRSAALAILRNVDLTNHSEFIKKSEYHPFKGL